MRPVVVVVGSLNMDFAVTADHLPVAGETVHGRGFRMSPGGKGANQAVAAAKLGTATVKMIGRVGYDLFADHLKASLASAGVDVSGIQASQSHPTGAALITVDSAGQNQIVVAGGANMDLHPADVEAMRRVFRGAQIALFQLETPLATVAAALKIAREEGVRTILDPAPAQPLPPEMLRHADILTPNETEACTLLGRSPERILPEDAQSVAVAIGARTVILKLGDRGCFLYSQEESYHVPAFRVHPIDTTAAGDIFNGALAIALSERSPLYEALRFASAAAAIGITREGAQTSAPSRLEVERFLVEQAVPPAAV